jgi:hypothetical protein
MTRRLSPGIQRHRLYQVDVSLWLLHPPNLQHSIIRNAAFPRTGNTARQKPISGHSEDRSKIYTVSLKRITNKFGDRYGWTLLFTFLLRTSVSACMVNFVMVGLVGTICVMRLDRYGSCALELGAGRRWAIEIAFLDDVQGCDIEFSFELSCRRLRLLSSVVGMNMLGQHSRIVRLAVGY